MSSASNAPKRARGLLVPALTATAITLGTLAVATGPAAAVGGCTLTGAANGSIGVGQSLSVTDCFSATTLTATYTALNGAASTTSMTVDANGGGTFTWFPNIVGVANLSTNATNNSGILASVNISAITTTTAIAAAGTVKVNSATTLTATVQSASPSVTLPLGRVTFADADNRTIGTADLARGATTSQAVGSISWTPTTPGNSAITALFTPSNVTNQPSTTASSIGGRTFTVTGTLVADTITVTPQGGTTWAANGTYTLGGATTTNFTVTTASGAKVALTDIGPCTTPGLSVVTPASTATCVLTFSSPGANTYGPAAQTITVSVGLQTQTANIAAPASGRVNRGRTLTLEAAGQSDTNAGQNITWRVNSNRNRCSLGFPNSGAVTLRIKQKGICSVTGTAPGVANTWAPYSISLRYRGI